MALHEVTEQVPAIELTSSLKEKFPVFSSEGYMIKKNWTVSKSLLLLQIKS